MILMGEKCLKCEGRGVVNPGGSMMYLCPVCRGQSRILDSKKHPAMSTYSTRQAHVEVSEPIPVGDGGGGDEGGDEEDSYDHHAARKSRGRKKGSKNKNKKNNSTLE